MRLSVARGFLTQAECDALNAWVVEGIERGWVDVGFSNRQLIRTRLTSRLYGHRFEYPDTVLNISARIRAYCGVSDAPLITGHGRDGVVVSCTFNGGDTYEHQDPRSVDGLATLRCNVLTQKPKAGGVLYIEDQPVELGVGDLHCYLASEHKHRVDTTHGDVPRILWMFGAYVDADDWNSKKIKVGEIA